MRLLCVVIFLPAFIFSQEPKLKFFISAMGERLTMVGMRNQSMYYGDTQNSLYIKMGFPVAKNKFITIALNTNQRAGEYKTNTRGLGSGQSQEGSFNIRRGELQTLWYKPYKHDLLSGFSVGTFVASALSAVGTSTVRSWSMTSAPEVTVYDEAKIQFIDAGLIGQITFNFPVIARKHYITVEIFGKVGSGDIVGFIAPGFGIAAGYTFLQMTKHLETNSVH